MDIFTACKRGDSEFVSAYLKSGGNANVSDSNRMTPLLLAVDNRQPAIIGLLIRAKADLNLKDRWGQTALILAAGRNDVASVKMLIAAGADLQVKAVNGLTAHGYAADNGFHEIAAALKKAGAR